MRSQIFLTDPLPAINRVFSMVVQQERQLVLSSPTEPNAFVNSANHSFFGKGCGSGPSSALKGASTKKCSYCHRPGHTIDVCWGKHGYPPSHPRYPGRPKFNRDAFSSSSINNVAVIEPTEGGNSFEKEGGPITLTQAQYQTLMSLLQPQQQKNSSDVTGPNSLVWLIFNKVSIIYKSTKKPRFFQQTNLPLMKVLPIPSQTPTFRIID